MSSSYFGLRKNGKNDGVTSVGKNIFFVPVLDEAMCYCAVWRYAIPA